MKGLSEKVVTGGFVLALLMLCGVGIESYLSAQKLIENRRLVEHTYQVLEALNNILNGMDNAERGRRGYAFLKDSGELKVINDGIYTTNRAIATVRQLTSDNPDQKRRLDEAEPLITKRLALLKQFVSLRQNRAGQAAETDIIKRTLILQRELQIRLQGMKDAEQTLLQQRSAVTDASLQRTSLINGIGYVLSFCLLIGVFFLLQKQIRIRKQAEVTVQKQAEEVYDLYNRAPCGYHSLNPEGIFIRINDTALNWLGYTRNEVLQKKFTDFITEKSLRVFQGGFPKFKAQGWISDLEFELIRKDGTILPVSLSATAITDADDKFIMSRSTLFDIRDRKQAEEALQRANEQLEMRVQERTAELNQVNASLQTELNERKRAEKALSGSEHQLRLITDALPVLISYVDSEQYYRFNNRAYEQWFGYSRSEITGKHLSQVLGESAYQAIEPQITAVMAGKEVTYESAVPYLEGVRWISAVYIPDFAETGKVKGYFALITDITDRKRAEQVLQQANEELEIKVQERTVELKQLNEDLVRSNQELEQFAYVASHDLQEPLRAVTGYTQLLVQDYQDRLDGAAQEYTDYIVDGAKRMQQLIQDLLSYSRIGTRDLTLVSTDCHALLNQVLKSLQVAIAESNTKITLDPLPTVIADKNQLSQLFQNLIGNAIKFRRDVAPQIHISAELKEGEWLFRVQDNGIGIKPRYLDRIFEIFKRLHTRTEFPGTGIGLAICKKIVDRHNGQIWAESQPGVGTTFYFTIPHHT